MRDLIALCPKDSSMSRCRVLLGSGRGCLWVCMCSGLICFVFWGWAVLLENFNPEIWPSPSQYLLFLFYKLFMGSLFLYQRFSDKSPFLWIYLRSSSVRKLLYWCGSLQIWGMAHCPLSEQLWKRIYVSILYKMKKKKDTWESVFNACTLFHQITEVMGHRTIQEFSLVGSAVWAEGLFWGKVHIQAVK